MKNFFIITALLLIAHNNYGQGSADQWKYSPSNPTGIRYADFSPKDYKPATAPKKKDDYSPPAATTGMYPKKKGKLWGYMGSKGKWAIEPQWEWVGPFGDKDPASYVYPTWVLGYDNLGRVIDRSGNYISDAYTLEYHGFNVDYLVGHDSHKREFIYRIPTQDSILLPDGLTMGSADLNDSKVWQYHLIYGKDANGKLKAIAILDIFSLKIVADQLGQYDYVGGDYGVYNDRIMVRNNNKSGYIDMAGKLVIPLQYDRADSFKDGSAAVEKDGIKFKIDVNGNRIQ